MLNSSCPQTYGLEHYQQGLKRDSMTRQDNWDLKRQRYWLKCEISSAEQHVFSYIHLNLAKSQLQLYMKILWVKLLNLKLSIYVCYLVYELYPFYSNHQGVGGISFS